MTRQEVYALVDGERDYQDRKHPNSTALEVGSALALMKGYLNEAIVQWSFGPGDEEGLEFIRKVVAIGVRAMEMHGAPPRSE